MKMNSKQIAELNNLLVDHSETLTAFYDEGIDYGMRIGCVAGGIAGMIGTALGCGISLMISHRREKQEKES